MEFESRADHESPAFNFFTKDHTTGKVVTRTKKGTVELKMDSNEESNSVTSETESEGSESVSGADLERGSEIEMAPLDGSSPGRKGSVTDRQKRHKAKSRVSI